MNSIKCICSLFFGEHIKYHGPVFQSIVSLTSSLVLKMLTIQVSTISDSQVFAVNT